MYKHVLWRKKIPSHNLNTCNNEKLKLQGDWATKSERSEIFSLDFMSCTVTKPCAMLLQLQPETTGVWNRVKTCTWGFCFLFLPSETFQDDETTSVKDCFESFKKPRNILNVLIPLHTWDICFPPVIHSVHKLKGTLFHQLWQIKWEIRRTSVCKCFMLVCLIYAAERVVQQGVFSDVVWHSRSCFGFFLGGEFCLTAEFKDNEVSYKTLYCLSYVLLDYKMSSLISSALHLTFISIFVCLFVFVDEPQPLSQLNGALLAPGPLPPLATPPTPPMDSPVPSVCPLMPPPTPPLIPPSSSSPGCGSGSASSEQPGSGPLVSGAASTSASSSPSNLETEEDKAKKLLYCSLCKVAVNSLSQLEAHNKGGLICELWYT